MLIRFEIERGSSLKRFEPCLLRDIAEGGSCRMIFDKTVLIKQLTVVEAHGILLIRTDRGLCPPL